MVHGTTDLAVHKSITVAAPQQRAFDVFTTNLQSPLIYAATKDGKVYAIHPVLNEGEVGHMVRGGEKRGPRGEFKLEPLALARAR